MLSRCFLDFSVGVGAFVTGLSQISSFFFLQLLCECHCLWTNEFARAILAKFYGRLRLIRSVWRVSIFSVLILIEIVILWVFYTIPFGISLFRQFRAIIFNFCNH